MWDIKTEPGLDWWVVTDQEAYGPMTAVDAIWLADLIKRNGGTVQGIRHRREWGVKA